MKYLVLIGCLLCPIQFIVANETPPAAGSAQSSAAEVKSFTGKVVETMSTAGYTYVLVDTGSKKLWAAAVQFAVKVGDTVNVMAEMPMPNYHSKSLDRDFELIYFAGRISVNTGGSEAVGGLPALPAGHPPLKGETARPKLDLSGIKRADGGQTIQEIFAAKSTIAGKPARVRGKVVKYNSNILGKNWLHIQDGTGNAANKDNDLMVTTATTAKVGDMVLVTGNVSTDKDFGAGYKYSLLIEEAKVTVE